MGLRIARHLLKALLAAAITVLVVLATRPHPVAFNLEAMRLQGTDLIALPATNRIAFTPSVEHLLCWRQTPVLRIVVPANYNPAASRPFIPATPWTVSRDGTNLYFMASPVPRGL